MWFYYVVIPSANLLRIHTRILVMVSKGVLFQYSYCVFSLVQATLTLKSRRISSWCALTWLKNSVTPVLLQKFLPQLVNIFSFPTCGMTMAYLM